MYAELFQRIYLRHNFRTFGIVCICWIYSEVSEKVNE